MQIHQLAIRYFLLALLAALPQFGHAHGEAMQKPAIRPSLAIGAAYAPDGTLWLAGLDGNGKLYTRSSADAGKTWAAPRLLDIGADSVAAEGENRPKLAFGPGKLAVIAYTHPLTKPYTGEIRLLRSDDGGKTFSPPVTVHQDRQVITHRFESILFDRNGVLHSIWVDKRDAAQAAGKDGKYPGAAIYRNESTDGGLSFGPDIQVAEHSCECCRIALAQSPAGEVVALWRHVFAPNIRDHAFARLRSGSAPVRATLDNWQLDACPHHGPGLAAAQDGGYHSVWFGERAGRMAVRYGRLDVGGTPVGAVQELPDAQAEHADVAAVADSVAIVWRSYAEGQTHLRAWLSGDGGAHFQLRELAASTEENDQPRLVTSPHGIQVLWRTAREIQTYALAP